MGASKEKRIRKSQEKSSSFGNDLQKKEQETARKYRRNAWLVVGIVVIMAALVVVVNSNLFYTGLPAVTIGDTEYNAAEVTYFYKTAYYEFANTYGNYVSLFFDPSKPLKDQAYSDTQSWADYFAETAMENMRNVTMLCDEANKAGFTLDQSYLDEINQSIEDLRQQVQISGYYTSLNQYFAAAYGKGVTEEVVRSMSELNYLANAYYQHLVDSYQYSPEELEGYYQENADKYDIFNFYNCYIPVEKDEEKGIDEDAALAEAMKKGEKIASAKSLEEFLDLAEKNSDGGADIYHTSGGNLYELYADWLKDASRKAGDTTALADEKDGVYVLYYLGRENNHYKTVDVRHILVATEKDENNEYTQEAKDAALEKAESILAEWKAGEATEDSFAQLAIKYSEDTGSVDNGGLYENIYKYAMVEAFNDYIFDPARKPGDVDIVYGTSSAYEGYHIIYFVNHGEQYSDQLARRDLVQKDYDDWKNERIGNYTVTEEFSYRFANR